MVDIDGTTRPVDIEKELQKSYLDYAMSVIIGRALPDVRDGLKPVHRRVLYGMWESGNRASRPYKKSARIVGDVMGKYHPHGDTAIYDTIVRMAQDFSQRYTLVDGQGNFGSIDGDSAAAMRYTEVRLTRLSEEMLKEDIDKETVDWVANYDESELEPQVLPTRIPNLLVNGSTGIAVGMATNIPPHNLGEVIDATVLMIDQPDASFLDIYSVLPGPDFPTAAFIHGVGGIQQAYTTGKGTVQVRSRADIEQLPNDKQRIIVTELPYQVNKARLIEKIADLVRDKKIDSISDIRDESDRQGIRLVIELKRGELGDIVLNTLYKMTQLQTSFGINMLAIVRNQPRVLNIKDILIHFINHRRAIVVRRTEYDLRHAEARAHLLEGLLKALDHIDEVITAIRSSSSPDDARSELISLFGFTFEQAKAILEMRLQRLTGLEREKLIKEYDDLIKSIEQFRAILASDELLLEEIKEELLEIKERYGDSRRTEIISEVNDITIEDMIADEDMVITVTKSGYIKRSPLSLYREQGRGGKGRKGMETKQDDFVEHVFVASAHSFVLVFTERGRVFWLKVHRIPELSPSSKGTAIVNLLDLEASEKIATTFAVKAFEEGFLVFATENGTVKRTPLNAFSNPRAGGIIAINVEEGNRLLDVRLTSGRSDILLATAEGLSIRFPEEDEVLETGKTLTGVRSMGRVARGVKGIDLRDADRVVAMEAIDAEGYVLTLTSRGFGKRTRVSEYRRQSRGGKGIINIKLTERTGEVVSVKYVYDGEGTVIITQLGKIIRSGVDGVSCIGRATQGVKLMDIEDRDRVVAMAKITERDEDDNAASEAQQDSESEPVN